MPINQPNLSNINLAPCCRDTLDYIKVATQGSKLFQYGLLPAVFLSLLVSPKDGMGRGSAIGTIIFISQTDWAGLAQITVKIPEIARRAIRTECHIEGSRHSGKLQDFWAAMMDAF